MKNTIYLLILLSIGQINAQSHPHWLNYTYAARVPEIDIIKDDVWVCTFGGLVKYNKKTGDKTFFNRANANLPDNYLLGLSHAENGIIYVGGKHYGIGILQDSLCTIFNQANSGLPSDQYNVMVRNDKKGNLWIASFSWIAKYNGQNWKTWNTGSDLAAFPIVSDIFISDSGVVWIYCTKGLCKIENDFFTVVNNLGLGGGGNAKSGDVIEDSNGVVWVAVYGMGLYKFDGNSVISYNSSNSCLPTNDILQIDFDNDGKMWLATSEGLVMFNEAYCKVFQPSGNNKSLFSLKCDESNIIWCGTLFTGKLLKFDGVDFSYFDISNSPLKSNYINDIIEDAQRNIWLGSNENTIKIQDDSMYQVFERTIECGVLDNSGSLWLAFREGDTTFLKISKEHTEVFDTTNSPFRISPGWIYSIDVDNNNNIWISTKGNGLFKYDGKDFIRFNKTNSQLPSNIVFKTVFDLNNNLWCGTDAGLVKYDGVTWTVWDTYNSSIPTNTIINLIVDSESNIWFSCMDDGRIIGIEYGGGITRFDGANMTSFDIYNSGLRSNTVFDLIEDNNKLWMGTCATGINTYDKVLNKWEYYDVSNSGISNNHVQKIIKDKKGNFWLGHIWGGVSVFNPDSVIQIYSLSNEPIKMENSKPWIKLYPNPVKNDLFVELNINKEKIKRAIIYDLKGNQIEIIPVITTNTENHFFQVNLPQAIGKNQIYILSIETENGNIINTKFLLSK